MKVGGTIFSRKSTFWSISRFQSKAEISWPGTFSEEINLSGRCGKLFDFLAETEPVEHTRLIYFSKGTLSCARERP